MIGALVTWIAGSRATLAFAKWAAIGLSILLFLLALRQSGEHAGRLAVRLEYQEKTNDIQRRMLKAAARRPRNRDELVERLRDGEF